jgi:DNA-binding protein HU-beta
VNKTELCEAAAGELGKKGRGTMSKTFVEDALNACLGVIQGELAAGREVKLTGFGKFEVLKSAARTGRNPKTGAAIQIPAKNRPRFSPGKGLLEAVNS